MPVRQDAERVLRWLSSYKKSDDDPAAGRYYPSGPMIATGTSLPPPRVNTAVRFLHERGYADAQWSANSSPFLFAYAGLTPGGLMAAEESLDGSTATESAAVLAPAGSPYGFTEHDWQAVLEARAGR